MRHRPDANDPFSQVGSASGFEEGALLPISIAADAEAYLASFERKPLSELLRRSRAIREQGHGHTISYSRKVFIPLTRLCRDSCAYCTFATTPANLAAPYLSAEEVLAIARGPACRVSRGIVYARR